MLKPPSFMRFYLQKDETIVMLHSRNAPSTPSHFTRKRAIRSMPSSQAFPAFPPNFEAVCPSAFASPRKNQGSRSSQGTAADRKRLKDAAGANRVLLLGRIHELALYRAEVLSDRGFDVRTSTNKEEAVKLIRRADFDVVVLSYTLSTDTVEELAEEIREHCPSCPLVVISQTPLPDRKIAPDAIAVAGEGPKALVAALRRVLRRH